MSSRTKKKVLANITLEEAQEASETFVANATKLARIEVKMNEEINRIKSKYTDEITALTNAQVHPTEVLNVFATEQQKNWGKKKSFELMHSIIGFRTGTPKVTKNKKYTWEGITDIVKEAFPELVRTKDELNKEAIIALSKNEEEFSDVREQCFIDVIQEETFYVEEKKEAISEAV